MTNVNAYDILNQYRKRIVIERQKERRKKMQGRLNER